MRFGCCVCVDWITSNYALRVIKKGAAEALHHKTGGSGFNSR